MQRNPRIFCSFSKLKCSPAHSKCKSLSRSYLAETVPSNACIAASNLWGPTKRNPFECVGPKCVFWDKTTLKETSPPKITLVVKYLNVKSPPKIVKKTKRELHHVCFFRFCLVDTNYCQGGEECVTMLFLAIF